MLDNVAILPQRKVFLRLCDYVFVCAACLSGQTKLSAVACSLHADDWLGQGTAPLHAGRYWLEDEYIFVQLLASSARTKMLRDMRQQRMQSVCHCVDKIYKP